MTDIERADLKSQLFQMLQQLQFGHDQIISEADKPQKVNYRIAQLQKMMRRFEDDLRRLLEMHTQDDIAKAIMNYNGHLGAKGTGA